MVASLASPSNAAGLKDVLRRSPYTFHRVRMVDLLAAPELPELGSRLITELGPDGAQIVEMLRGRSDLAVWIPNRAQRLGWAGAPNVSVAVQLSEDEAIRTVWRHDGSRTTISELKAGARGSRRTEAYVRVGPAPALAIRSNPQAKAPGATVQDADDGEYGGVVVAERFDGFRRVEQMGMMIDFAERRANQTRAGGFASFRVDRGTQPSVMASNTTYVKGLIVVDGSDFGSPGDPQELRWFAKHRNRATNYVYESVSYTQTVGSNFANEVEIPIIEGIQTAGTYVWWKFSEDDGGWGLEEFHEFHITDESLNWQNKSWSVPRFGGGADRCNSSNGFPCPLTAYGSAYYWRENNYNIAWQPYSAPPSGPPPLTVAGPSTVQPYETLNWSAENLSGAAPYSYQWTLNGTPVGTESTYSTNLGPVGSNHMLDLEVVDANGYWQGVTLPIFVSTCPPEMESCYESLRASPPAPVRPRFPMRRTRE